VASFPRKWSILLLVQDRMDDPVQLAEILPRCTERLLVHDAGALGEPVLAQGLRQPGKCDGRDGQVVDKLRVPAQRPAGLAQDAGQAARAVGAEPAVGEEHPLREGIQLLRFRLGAEFGERLVDMGTEVLMCGVAAAIAHQQPLPATVRDAASNR
jgi:hypothetical protein